MGFEPTTFCMASRRSSQLSYSRASANHSFAMMGSMSNGRQRLERQVLLGPGIIRRAAAGRVPGAQERWMLVQSKEVRHSYVAEVLDRPGDPELLAQIWMMGQPDDIRRSYVAEVLEPEL